MKKIIYTLDTIHVAVEELYALLPYCAVFTFSGTLGAGKTTLVQHLLKRCGVQDIITSPTFTYVNIYTNKQNQTFYHFDLYRLHTMRDFIDAGFYEYLYQPESWCFIEWPDVIQPLLVSKVCHLSIDYYETNRILSISLT